MREALHRLGGSGYAVVLSESTAEHADSIIELQRAGAVSQILRREHRLQTIHNRGHDNSHDTTLPATNDGNMETLIEILTPRSEDVSSLHKIAVSDAKK